MKIFQFIIVNILLLLTSSNAHAQENLVGNSKNNGDYQSSPTLEKINLLDSSLVSSLDLSKIEAVPIIMYDTDIGFGYGGKIFFLNQLDSRESIDLTLFNSTKGERWYRIVFSIPDFEMRQRKTYPVSFDFILDYDKMIKNNFFGVGSNSKLSAKETYTKEPIEASIVVGRGFSNSIIGQIGLKYKSIKSFNYETDKLLKMSNDIFQLDKIFFASCNFNLRYDTRNSFINPTSGKVLSFEGEFSIPFIKSNVVFTKLISKIQNYLHIQELNTTLASRIEITNLLGEKIPIQLMTSLGGTNNLRGFPAERFLEKNSLIANVELRRQILESLGGIIGIDAGNIFPTFRKFSNHNWEINTTFGLRLLLDTFVVRLDIGISQESTGLYLNFGHLF